MAANVTLKITSIPEDMKLPKQAREILEYMINNPDIPKGEPMDQKDLMANLDFHQEDNQVLSVTPKQPISRIFQFYRKRLTDAGILEYERMKAEPKAKKEKVEGEAPARRKKKADVEEEAAA